MRNTKNKILALVVAAMVFTMMPLTAFAEGGLSLGDSGDTATPTDIIIAALDDLDDYTLYQGYDFDSVTLDDLDLPETLTGEDADGEPLTIEGVVWQSAPDFDPAVEIAYPGYVFTPTLPEGYILAEGVKLPMITVFIRPEGGVQIQPLAAPSVVQNLIATPYDGRVVLTWDAPANNGGNDIEDYQIGCGITYDGWETGITSVQSPTLTYTITGLTNNTTYYIGLLAYNGEQGPLSRTTATPQAGPTSSIANIVAGTLVNRSLSGSFTGGANIASSSALTVTIPDASKTNAVLRLTKGDTAATVKYVVNQGTQPAGDGDYTEPFNDPYTQITVADGDTIWLMVTAEDTTTKSYYKITVTVTPAPTPITTAAITVTAPVTGAAPDTTATAGSAEYTCSAVTWTPTVNPGGKFLGSESYTAMVTLTAASGYEFTILPTSTQYTINGGTTSAPGSTATSATISYTFGVTAAKTVSGIAIKTQPTKLSYAEGETLDLTGLAVTLTYNDGTTADVPFASFGANSISANPAHGTAMVAATHNGNPVVVSCNGQTANTSNLAVQTGTSVDPDNGNTGGGGGGSTTTTTTTKPDETTLDKAITDLKKLESGDSITLDMNGKTVVPGKIFEAIAGQDIEVAIDMGGGVTWAVNGSDIPTGVNLADLNLAVSMGGDYIAQVQNIDGSVSEIQLQLAHTGEFGFEITLTVALDTVNAGYFANLFYYNPDTGALEFQCAAKVASDGSVSFPFTHASDYVIAVSTASLEPISWQNPFADVAKSARYYNAVRYAYENGLFSGTSATTFSPNVSMTRGMLVTVLWRMAGEPEVEPMYAAHMMDVAQGAYYENAMGWAVKEGIISGYGEGFYGPSDPITREQLVTILYRYVQQNGGGFEGAWAFLLDFEDREEVSDWAYEAVCWCSMNGIISGKGGGIIDPKGTATRAEVAQMLYNFLALTEGE